MFSKQLKKLSAQRGDRVSERNTHRWWKARQAPYSDDRIQLGHGHLLGPLHSLDHLLLMLQNKHNVYKDQSIYQ